MTKHILDRPVRLSGAMLPRSVAISRMRLPQRSSLVLQRRARKMRAGQRVKNFIRVARQGGPVV